MAGFKPEKYAAARTLALYSAAIALSDDEAMTRVIEIGKRYSLNRDTFYEMVLQSYLFLGFPRMLSAAENLHKSFRLEPNESALERVSEAESRRWYDNGIALCQKVYGDKYVPLKEKVMAMAPDVFRWMVIEGYGKVLSRPELEITVRELSIIAFLMMENREKQLYAHIMGALNVGASCELLRYVVNDIGEAAGDGYRTSLSIMEQMGLPQCAD